ncbi:hypothetical protein Sjap_010098 [Stephania japonica]|uniref:Uncharacterized protein n=1 Tax=Stephania japonica TaxID=461633 RepID=A0AAP0P6T9_9MAGN
MVHSIHMPRLEFHSPPILLNRSLVPSRGVENPSEIIMSIGVVTFQGTGFLQRLLCSSIVLSLDESTPQKPQILEILGAQSHGLSVILTSLCCRAFFFISNPKVQVSLGEKIIPLVWINLGDFVSPEKLLRGLSVPSKKTQAVPGPEAREGIGPFKLRAPPKTHQCLLQQPVKVQKPTHREVRVERLFLGFLPLNSIYCVSQESQVLGKQGVVAIGLVCNNGLAREKGLQLSRAAMITVEISSALLPFQLAQKLIRTVLQWNHNFPTTLKGNTFLRKRGSRCDPVLGLNHGNGRFR